MSLRGGGLNGVTHRSFSFVHEFQHRRDENVYQWICSAERLENAREKTELFDFDHSYMWIYM